MGEGVTKRIRKLSPLFWIMAKLFACQIFGMCCISLAGTCQIFVYFNRPNTRVCIE